MANSFSHTHTAECVAIPWAISSVGRTLVLHTRCRGFKPHMCPPKKFKKVLENILVKYYNDIVS